MQNDDYDQRDHPMDGFIFGCSAGVLIWFVVYHIWQWVTA